VLRRAEHASPSKASTARPSAAKISLFSQIKASKQISGVAVDDDDDCDEGASQVEGVADGGQTLIHASALTNRRARCALRGWGSKITAAEMRARRRLELSWGFPLLLLTLGWPGRQLGYG